MKHIKVPTFLVGQFQDEQTGGHFPESLAALKNNPKVWITLQNGVHADSLGPATITRWAEFMKLYVGNEIPVVPPSILALSGELYKYLADAGASPVEQSRFAGDDRRGRGQGRVRARPARAADHGQRRRPRRARLDRRDVGAGLRLLARPPGAGDARTTSAAPAR